jgi:hypothetical protein
MYIYVYIYIYNIIVNAIFELILGLLNIRKQNQNGIKKKRTLLLVKMKEKKLLKMYCDRYQKCVCKL